MSDLFTKRNVIISLVLLMLAVSIYFGVGLVQQQTKLSPKATGSEVKFKGSNVSPNPCDPSNGCVATNRNIEIEVTSPFGAP